MKILYFFEMCAYGFGAIGGFSWSLYNNSYLIAVCVVILALMAIPELKRAYKKLTE